jgi:hypothetical protein
MSSLECSFIISIKALTSDLFLGIAKDELRFLQYAFASEYVRFIDETSYVIPNSVYWWKSIKIITQLSDRLAQPFLKIWKHCTYVCMYINTDKLMDTLFYIVGSYFWRFLAKVNTRTKISQFFFGISQFAQVFRSCKHGLILLK